MSKTPMAIIGAGAKPLWHEAFSPCQNVHGQPCTGCPDS